MSPHTAFISGHGNLTQEEFLQHYVPQITSALADGVEHFVVGDFRGADTLGQEYLAKNHPAVKVTVYHMFENPRSTVPSHARMGGFTTDEERDSAMTKASSRDIAWIRPGKKKSGTAQNIARRQAAL